MTSSVEAIRSVKGHYRSGRSDLGQDFFSLCLSHCSRYRRAAGYFSSSALVTWSGALANVIAKDDVTISLLVSPALSEEDIGALARTLNPAERQALCDRLLDEFLGRVLDGMSPDELTEWRLDLLSWMVAHDRLVLRFAFPTHVEGAAIFHEKIGVFDFPDGSQIAFTGSANETFSGYHRNYESIDVYRSWESADEERVRVKVEQFEEAWKGEAFGLQVRVLTHETIERLRARAPEQRPPSSAPAASAGAIQSVVRETGPSWPDGGKWRHQEEAIATFLRERRGILEMATGTGKTKTATKALDRLLATGEVHGAIVATEGTDLLDQWRSTLDRWALDRGDRFRVLGQYGSNRDARQFARSPQRAVLVISRPQLKELFENLKRERRHNLLIIHDEVHGLGAPSLVRQLEGEHASFPYVLGLTATPEREYDAEGSAFIEREVGPAIYQFGLEEAIQRGILCEFDYLPLPFTLTEDDNRRIQAIWARQAAAKKAGTPVSPEEVYREVSMVYKTAEMKPSVFRDFVSRSPDILASTIVFVATKDYGTQFLSYIQEHTYNYRTYYSEDDRQNLIDFGQGKIDCLITCHRISQGIDVPGLQNVILVSSDRARLETIQRIGRCLRTDPSNPEKRARVVDLVGMRPRDPDPEWIEADEHRMQWLSELAKTKRTL